MIDEFRLLIFEVTERLILTLSFNNPKSPINNLSVVALAKSDQQSIPLRLTAAVASASLSEFVYKDQGQAPGQMQMELREVDPIIRPLSDYAAFIRIHETCEDDSHHPETTPLTEPHTPSKAI